MPIAPQKITLKALGESIIFGLLRAGVSQTEVARAAKVDPKTRSHAKPTQYEILDYEAAAQQQLEEDESKANHRR